MENSIAQAFAQLNKNGYMFALRDILNYIQEETWCPVNALHEYVTLINEQMWYNNYSTFILPMLHFGVLTTRGKGSKTEYALTDLGKLVSEALNKYLNQHDPSIM